MKVLNPQKECSLENDILQCYLRDAVDKLHKAGREALQAFAEGDELRMMLLGLKRFTKLDPHNGKEARRRISQQLIEANHYCF